VSAAQTWLLIALGAFLVYALGYALYELAGRSIDRHVEAAFNDHAYDAIALTTEPPLLDRVAAVLAPDLVAEAEALLRGEAR
jgi:hypothetical protein